MIRKRVQARIKVDRVKVWEKARDSVGIRVGLGFELELGLGSGLI